MTRMFSFPAPDEAGEPVRDARLGALLRDVVGEAPMTSVDWTALADRIGTAARLQQTAPWWSYVERWQRRALPLALAAGLVGGLALWHSALHIRVESVAVVSPDLVSSVVAGTPSVEAALSYAHTVTSSEELTTRVPE